MIGWLAKLYDPYIGHLEAEIEWYRVQLIHERNRAERAVDQLLNMRGAPPVTPPPEPDQTATMLQEAMRVMQGEEFQKVGVAE